MRTIYIPDFLIVLKNISEKSMSASQIQHKNKMSYSFVHNFKKECVKRGWVEINQIGITQYMQLTEKGLKIVRAYNNLITALEFESDDMLIHRRRNKEAMINEKNAEDTKMEYNMPELQKPTEEPVTEEPVTEEPVTEEPVTEEPVTEEPVTEEPVTEEPVTEEPVTEEPVTEEPVTEEPVTEEPVTEEPVTEEPVTEEPVTEDDTLLTKNGTNLDNSAIIPEIETMTDVEIEEMEKELDEDDDEDEIVKEPKVEGEEKY